MMLLLSLGWSGMRADEQVTVSASSREIADNLDLKVVAKLFAEAKDLEEFEALLNNPDSAFSNLDLNGDGEIDYLRVVETGEGSKRLIVLQAILAKDIYQDVASIHVVKDDDGNVTVQVVGEEKVYGREVIIEPVYIYRPVIYDWFWGPSWTVWHSPYYWDYWPVWWYHRPIVDWHVYHHHCHAYCHRDVRCSYRYHAGAPAPRHAARDAHHGGHRSDNSRMYGSSNVVNHSDHRPSAGQGGGRHGYGRQHSDAPARQAVTRQDGSQRSVNRTAVSRQNSVSAQNRSSSVSSSSSSSYSRPASSHTSNGAQHVGNAVRSYNSSSSVGRSTSGYSGGGAAVRSSGGGGGGGRSAVRR